MRILFFVFTFTCLAQNNDQRLAYQYFVDGDYEKAIVLYEEIVEKFSLNTYNPYYTSLINLNRFSEAEKIARKQFAKNYSRLNFTTDVIVAQYKLNQKNKYSSNIKKIIKQINEGFSSYPIANRFQFLNYIQSLLKSMKNQRKKQHRIRFAKSTIIFSFG